MKLLLIPLLLTLFAVVQAHVFSGAKALDKAVANAIERGELPGAVLLIGHGGRVVYRKAYGDRAVVPATEPMTADTIFDCASLTKVIATTPALMQLYEQGRFRLSDRVTQYIPEFMGGKSTITIRNLMTHFSGLRPDVPLRPPWSGYDAGVHLACTFPPYGPPGVKHVYSDINFILLGEIVHRLSGQTLADYTRDHVFGPLGMKDTAFQPPTAWLPRIAPTEILPGETLPLRGVVHDPTARAMGGIAGHAGLFSTADDLARFAQMMLNRGELNGKRIVSAETVDKFTEPQTPMDQPILRGLGWDIDSPFSGNRGELFPIGSYGHTGFTGTSIWIDPGSQTYVILLANSVHPGPRPSLGPLRSEVATIAAAAVGITARRVILTGYNELNSYSVRRRTILHQGSTLTGLDVLEADGFAPFKGKRIGLVTNPSGLDRAGRRNVDLMRQAGIDIEALFAPEHGWAGAVDHAGIGDTTDRATGIKVFSLYGKHLRPTPEMLRGLDALVFDIQDVGVRFYTFETTMAYCMEAAAKAGIPYFVLDRPNPITGVRVEGPPLDSDNTSFVGYAAGMPVRHGMTMGELATMFNAERKVGAKLNVIRLRDWDRGDWFDSTGLTWLNPSPNMRSLNAATLYPGLCLLEFPPNFSVGRGTDDPFEQIGADFIVGRDLAVYLNRRKLPGVRWYATRFTPTESKFAGKQIEGVRLVIVDREYVDAVRVGLELCCAVQKLYPGKIDFDGGKRLIGSNDVIRRIEAGQDPEEIEDSYRSRLDAFVKLRAKYLLYK
ncbi:MAG: exo-beta-N-acetylmuramidase NamZ domain-containing protein [Fimbriimonadaceae bacterium]